MSEPCNHCNFPAQTGIIRTFDEPPEIVCDQCLNDLYPDFIGRVMRDREELKKLSKP